MTATPEIAGGMFRGADDERRFLAQREGMLRLTMSSVLVGVAALVAAGVLLDLAKLSGSDFAVVVACRGVMVACLLGGVLLGRRRGVEQLGAIMLASLVATFLLYGVVAATFLLATGRADYVILLSGSAALLLPIQIAPARKAWPLFATCVGLVPAIGVYAGLLPVDVAWNMLTVASCAALGLLLNKAWNTQGRMAFLTQERAVRAESELLAYESLSEEGSGLVGDIESTASRAAGLTRQLLLFSRRQPVRPRNLDLSAVVSNAKPLLERILGPESGLRLQLEERLPAVSLDLSHAEHVSPGRRS